MRRLICVLSILFLIVALSSNVFAAIGKRPTVTVPGETISMIDIVDIGYYRDPELAWEKYDSYTPEERKTMKRVPIYEPISAETKLKVNDIIAVAFRVSPLACDGVCELYLVISGPAGILEEVMIKIDPGWVAGFGYQLKDDSSLQTGSYYFRFISNNGLLMKEVKIQVN